MKLRINPARTGALWVRQGIQTFFKQPVAMSGLFLMFLALMSLLSAIPWVGSVLGLMLLPTMTVGLMAASEEVNKGRFPLPKVLFVALMRGTQHAQSMLVLGGIYAVAFLMVLGLTSFADGGQFAKLYLTGGTLSEELMLDDQFTQAALLAILFYLPLSMAFWHAPALVHWDNVTPIKSLFFSLIACIRNFWAFTIFGIAWMGAFIVTSTIIALLVTVLGQPQWVGFLLFPTIMVFGSMFFGSIVFSYRDCFELNHPTKG